MPKQPEKSNPDHDNWRNRVHALIAFANVQAGGNPSDMLVDLQYALVTVMAVTMGNNKEKFMEGMELIHTQLNNTAAEITEKMT